MTLTDILNSPDTKWLTENDFTIKCRKTSDNNITVSIIGAGGNTVKASTMLDFQTIVYSLKILLNNGIVETLLDDTDKAPAEAPAETSDKVATDENSDKVATDENSGIEIHLPEIPLELVSLISLRNEMCMELESKKFDDSSDEKLTTMFLESNVNRIASVHGGKLVYWTDGDASTGDQNLVFLDFSKDIHPNYHVHSDYPMTSIETLLTNMDSVIGLMAEKYALKLALWDMRETLNEFHSHDAMCFISDIHRLTRFTLLKSFPNANVSGVMCHKRLLDDMYENHGKLCGVKFTFNGFNATTVSEFVNEAFKG